MTLATSPWAVDGARISSALARTASFAESGGAEGVVSTGHLKVTPLDIPGVGVKVAAGSGLILNRYQSNPSQTYTVLNVGDEIIPSGAMPPANAAPRSHLVCVTIGDPEFSQVGHPWMTSDPIATPETFQYARFFIVPNVPANTTSFSQLGLSYPAYALARIDVPSNTTTVTSTMIKDLRKIARPRREEQALHWVLPAAYPYAGVGVWSEFGSAGGRPISVPSWASIAYVDAWVEGVILPQSVGVYGAWRFGFAEGEVCATPTTYDWTAVGATAQDRFSLNMGGYVTIPPSYRGTTKTFQFQSYSHGQPVTIPGGAPLPWSNGLRVDTGSSSYARITFVEETA